MGTKMGVASCSTQLLSGFSQFACSDNQITNKNQSVNHPNTKHMYDGNIFAMFIHTLML